MNPPGTVPCVAMATIRPFDKSGGSGGRVVIVLWWQSGGGEGWGGGRADFEGELCCSLPLFPSQSMLQCWTVVLSCHDKRWNEKQGCPWLKPSVSRKGVGALHMSKGHKSSGCSMQWWSCRYGVERTQTSKTTMNPLVCLCGILLDLLTVHSEYTFFSFVNKLCSALFSLKCWIVLHFNV